MPLYLGLDSSTQSISAMIIDAESHRIILEKSINFGQQLPQYGSPSGFIPGGRNGEVHSNPLMWLDALDLLLAELREACDLSQVVAICGSGQQHGSVYLNQEFASQVAALEPKKSLAEQLSHTVARRTSPIWMDASTTQQCQEIAASVGGDSEVCRITGSIAIERFTGSQIRKFAVTEPQAYADTTVIHLVSSFICSILAGKSAPIDFGDGAGMNLMNLSTRAWDANLMSATAPELATKLPSLAAAGSIVGCIHTYFVEKYGFASNCRIGTFTGDNPASLVGMGASRPGNVVISLGTSDTYFAAMPEAMTDPHGYGHVFGNPAGGFMSLVCFRNGSLAREALRDELGLSWSDFEREALISTPPGNNGNIMLPFFGHEITPRHAFTAPIRVGSDDFIAKQNSAEQVRALLEGQFINMRQHTRWIGMATERILLTGGASRNNGIAQIVADVFHAPVERLATANSAALGAALLAAISDDHCLTTLQQAFCQTDGTPRVEPSEGADYEATIAKFEATLQQSLQQTS